MILFQTAYRPHQGWSQGTDEQFREKSGLNLIRSHVMVSLAAGQDEATRRTGLSDADIPRKAWKDRGLYEPEVVRVRVGDPIPEALAPHVGRPIRMTCNGPEWVCEVW